MEIVISKGIGKIGNFKFKCAIGKNGVAINKSEGDLKTPKGTFSLRYVMYRNDRIVKPKTYLPIYPIKKNHIWCDNPKSNNYNQICERKEINETEPLWRKDSLYNIIIVVGYNDQPVQKDKGSAIFIHLTTKKYTPTKGCITLNLNDMKKLLSYNPKNIKII